jgi:hypothetical protein
VRGPRTPKHFIDQTISPVILAARVAHTEKPRVIHDIIASACPGPYIELFGRGHVRAGR